MTEPPDPHLEEIAEDMVHVLERLQSLERAVGEVRERLGQTQGLLSEEMSDTRRNVSALRRELLEEGKTRATRHAFDVVAPVLDSMRSMAAGMDPDLDARARAQVRGVISSLSTLLQGLGFEPFEADVGQRFDPSSMECVGFLEGDPTVVLRVDRPGYRANGTVVRPAGVWIAQPNRE